MFLYWSVLAFVFITVNMLVPSSNATYVIVFALVMTVCAKLEQIREELKK